MTHGGYTDEAKGHVSPILPSAYLGPGLEAPPRPDASGTSKGHSTVTLLARFRGLSMEHPFFFAT